MIKRIRLVTRRHAIAPEVFAARWTGAFGRVVHAPTDVRPARVAVCTTLPELSGPSPKHDGIGLEWFTDEHHLGRFESWLDGSPANGVDDDDVDADLSTVILADEIVQRGDDWLARRWEDGGPKVKHVALALRASGLTAAEFSARWRDHAGRVGGAEIPPSARGLAYVQNHPRPRSEGAWAYDAVNEVWFDDVESLHARIAWFDENVREGDGALVRQSWFLAVREELLFP